MAVGGGGHEQGDNFSPIRDSVGLPGNVFASFIRATGFNDMPARDMGAANSMVANVIDGPNPLSISEQT